MITDMGAEGVEETLQTAVDPLVRNSVFKENNNLLLSGKDYLDSFLVGALSVGALHAKSTAIGLSTDVKTMKMDVKLPDGTYVGADVINRYFNGNATKSDVDTIKQLGSSINEENMNSVLKRMDDIANVKMGKQTYGEMNKAMKGMTASQKIDHMAQVMSSPEFKAHTEELIKTAQEQKAKARDINKNKTADVIDIKQNAENINTYNSNSDNVSEVIEKADNIDSKSQVLNNNEALYADEKNNNEYNADVKEKSQNNAINENHRVDTDNGLEENNQADNNTNVSNVSNINNDSTSNVNSDGTYGNEGNNSNQGIANGDEIGYKGGKGKENPEINKNINEGLEHYNKVVSFEPKITEFITDMASKLSMNVEGLEYRIKSKDSYLRKLTTIKSKDKIRDIIRYTYSASSDTLSNKILETIEEFNNKNYTTVNIYNTWTYKFYPYKGINTIIKTPDGVVFELQYHTPESYKLKNEELHKLYEKQRLLEDTSSDEYIKLNNKMIELSNSLIKPLEIERIINK